MTAIECAKAIAQHLNWQGRQGGWIYDAQGKPLIQGWFGLAVQLKRLGWIVCRGSNCHIDWRKVPAPLWHSVQGS